MNKEVKDAEPSREIPAPVLSLKESLHLEPEPESAGMARNFLRDVLSRAERLDCLEVAELACSELVTNAVLHAHTPLEVTVSVATSIRVEVKDSSPVMPAHRGYDTQATTGRGLSLVAAITDDYGVVEGGLSGKTVWFSLGSESKERSEAEILADWDDEGWDLADPLEELETKSIKLERAPVGLWLAARQHNDALLRELVLYCARHPGLDVDIEETDEARFLISNAITSHVDAISVRNSLNSVPKNITLELEVPLDMGTSFRSMRKTLDVAEHLAKSGALLAKAGREEVIMVRNWICLQTEAQLRGENVLDWNQFKQAQEEEKLRFLDRALSPKDLKDISESSDAMIASDEDNVILCVSQPMAEMAGYTQDELAGRFLWELVPERLRKTHIMAFTRRSLGEEASVVDAPITLPLLRKDGSEAMCDFKVDLAGLKGTHATFVAKATLALEGEGISKQILNYADIFRQGPTPCLILDLNLTIVEANNVFLESTQRARANLLGRGYFECFPPDPNTFTLEGISPIEESLMRVKESKRPEAMGIDTYVTMDPAGSDHDEQYWFLSHSPILDANGEVELLLQRAENVTDFAKGQVHLQDGSLSDQQKLFRAEGLEIDLYSHAQELTEALRAKDVSARRLTSLAEGAPLLASVTSISELEDIVIRRGLKTLGADGGGILTRSPDGTWAVWASGMREDDPRIDGEKYPLNENSPALEVIRSGYRIILPTQKSGLSHNKEALQRLYKETELHGWAFLPLKVNDKILGSLSVGWKDEHHISDQELELLEALSAQTAQALERLEITRLQAETQAQVQALSEALQRSLLTHPPQSEDLEIEVRYQPAASGAEVGGDWYDAFRTLDGSTMVVVGDVSGHDQTAAALMGQLRNLLRGMAFDSQRKPDELLGRLDLAMDGLNLGVLASAIMAKVENNNDGTHQVSWSNAGHPPPILRATDGQVTVLEEQPDLLLGLDPKTQRHSHQSILTSGSILVFYTDGLIERRYADLGDGIKMLSQLIERNQNLDVSELADLILSSLAPEEQEDDIALLILKAN